MAQLRSAKRHSARVQDGQPSTSKLQPAARSSARVQDARKTSSQPAKIATLTTMDADATARAAKGTDFIDDHSDGGAIEEMELT